VLLRLAARLLAVLRLAALRLAPLRSRLPSH
jgi:hypothetical protein